MAKFCTSCGNALQPFWKICPYCSHPVYQAPTETYEHIDYQSVEPSMPEVIPKERKKLTRVQKRALVIGIPVIIAAIIIPIVSIAVYQHLFPQKTVSFYVDYGNTSASYTVSTTRDTLDYFDNLPHPSHTSFNPDFIADVIESYCTPNDSRMLKIANGIVSKCIDQYDSEEVVNGLLSFTQAIGYKLEFQDLAAYPMETIFDQGDCEDLSILFGSLVVALGYEAIICVINYYDENEAESFGHACIGVYLNFTPTYSYSFTVNSKDYWVCETTYQGWMVGQLPASNPNYYEMLAYEFVI